MKLSPAKHLLLVLLIALALRLAAAWWWHQRLSGGFAFGDSGGYWALAQAVAAGGPYQYGAETKIFRTPGYPMLLAPIFFLAGQEPSVFWARALGAVFGTFSVLAVWWLARRLFGAAAGMAAAWVAAVYPGAIATSILVLSEAPFCPLMLLHLGLWTAAWQAPAAGRAGTLAVLAGLAAGAGTLVRPSWLLFTPFALAIGVAIAAVRAWGGDGPIFGIFAARKSGQSPGRHLAIGLMMLGGLIAVMTPWWIRNLRVSGHFVATTLQVGASLYDGLNPEASGASDMRFVPRMAEAERADPAGAGSRTDDPFEYRLDHRMRSEAISWARQNPAAVARLAMVKLVRIWNVWPNEPSLGSWPVRLAVMGSYLPVMLLALVGAWRTIGRGWPYLLCWLPAVYFTLLHMVFVGSIRYRQPAMLALIVLAAGAAVELYRAAIAKRGSLRFSTDW